MMDRNDKNLPQEPSYVSDVSFRASAEGVVMVLPLLLLLLLATRFRRPHKLRPDV